MIVLDITTSEADWQLQLDLLAVYLAGERPQKSLAEVRREGERRFRRWLESLFDRAEEWVAAEG